MFRIILFISIILLIVLTVGGYIATSAGWLSVELAHFYKSHFSFVTGLASVVGLLAFASSKKIKSTDFEQEELEKLKRLMSTANELEDLESNKYQTEQELQELSHRQKIMELSVQKAGMVLFYKHQLERHEPQILDKIKNDKELGLAVREYTEAQSRLNSLNEEIEQDENADLMRQILRRHEAREHIESPLDTLVESMELITRAVGKIFRI